MTKASVLATNREIFEASFNADIPTLEKYLSDDMIFTHGDGWIRPGGFLRFDTKKQTLDDVVSKPHKSSIMLKSDAEMHGDVAVINGVQEIVINTKEELKMEITYVRVFQYRNDQWNLLSHKTVESKIVKA